MARITSNLNNKGASPSKVDSFSGEHTVTIIVAALFIVVLGAFLTLYCLKDKVPDNIVTSFFTLLGVLEGFFAGNAKKGNGK